MIKRMLSWTEFMMGMLVDFGRFGIRGMIWIYLEPKLFTDEFFVMRITFFNTALSLIHI